MPPVVDLVLDSKLQTKFPDPLTTVHTFIEPDGRQRQVHREEHWKNTRPLGCGGFGAVRLEQCVAGKGKGNMRAVKVIVKHSNSRQPIDFNRELETIVKFSHNRYNSWFVQSYGWFEDAQSIFIAMEYCKHGDLHHYLLNESFLPASEAQQLTHQILESLHHMHQNGFAHRDLKPGNILIKSRPPDSWWVVLADFGISKRAEDGNQPSVVKGTESYMAPEIRGLLEQSMASNSLDYKAGDMWALGEIAVLMLTSEPSFNSIWELISYCKGKQAHPSRLILPWIGNSGREFISKLMAVNPNDRINATEALQHDWMKSLYTDTVEDFEPMHIEQTAAPEMVSENIVQEPSASWTALSNTEASQNATQKKADSSYYSNQKVTPRMLKGHTAGVWAVSISPDGKHLASGSADKTIRLWDNNSRETLQTLKGHTGSVSAVLFSPEGKHLASGSADSTIRLWDIRSGVTVQTLKGHTDKIQTVSFSPDGKHLASGSRDNTIRLWDFRSVVAVQTLKGHKAGVWALSFSPDGKHLASGSGDNTIRLWDIRSGVTVQTLKGHKHGVLDLSLSPDGKQLASASADKTVRLWYDRRGMSA